MSHKTYDVIVVGWGLAGLTASAELSRLGYEVCLLEAKDRLGGRLQPAILNDQTLDFRVLELEPLSSNPLLKLFEDYSIQAQALDALNSDFFTPEGQRAPLNEWLNPLTESLEKASRKIQEAKLKTQAHLNKPSLSKALEYSKGLPTENSIAFKTRHFITAMVQYYTGAGPEEVSLLELMNPVQNTETQTFLVQNLYKLIEGLGKTCESRQNFSLFLKHRVRSIQHHQPDSILQVQTETGESYKAPAVVLAVPLNVLKKQGIQFQPELSQTKRKAIQHLNLGLENQVILEFHQAFWPENVHYLYPNHPDMDYWPEYINLMPFSKGQPILIAHLHGQQAQFAKRQESDVIESLLAPLKKAYQSAFKPLKNFQILHRDSAGAGVPYFGLFSEAQDQFAFSLPEHQGLYFTGYKPGLNAAYRSGVEAALKLDVYLKYARSNPASPSSARPLL